jgi:hypothetical protein
MDMVFSFCRRVDETVTALVCCDPQIIVANYRFVELIVDIGPIAFLLLCSMLIGIESIFNANSSHHVLYGRFPASHHRPHDAASRQPRRSAASSPFALTPPFFSAPSPFALPPQPDHRCAPAALPLGAMLLASSFGACAQTSPAETALKAVTVREQAEPAELQGKNSLRATESDIGKGSQALRDIPQSVTVMTETLPFDRNLDDFSELLKTTAGATFQAGETG